jgi:hypothetical protein
VIAVSPEDGLWDLFAAGGPPPTSGLPSYELPRKRDANPNSTLEERIIGLVAQNK